MQDDRRQGRHESSTGNRRDPRLERLGSDPGLPGSLRPTLGNADQVVVVDNGSTDGTAEHLAELDWLQVLTNEENRGSPRAATRERRSPRPRVRRLPQQRHHGPGRVAGGAAAALRGRTVSRDRSAVQRGQRHPAARNENYAVRLGSPTAAADLADFAWQVRLDSAGHRRETTRLVGFCLAVRRSAFEAIGGWDEALRDRRLRGRRPLRRADRRRRTPARSWTTCSCTTTGTSPSRPTGSTGTPCSGRTSGGWISRTTSPSRVDPGPLPSLRRGVTGRGRHLRVTVAVATCDRTVAADAGTAEPVPPDVRRLRGPRRRRRVCRRRHRSWRPSPRRSTCGC